MTPEPRSPARIWDIEKHFADLLSEEGPTDPTADQLMVRDLYHHYQQEKNRADKFRDKLERIWSGWRNWLQVSRKSSKHIEPLSYAKPEEFDIVTVSFPVNVYEQIDQNASPHFR